MLQTVASCCKHFFCSAVSAYGVFLQVTGNWLTQCHVTDKGIPQDTKLWTTEYSVGLF